jgi:hypothetical protein
MDNPEKLATKGARRKTQRNWQQRVHRTQDEEKLKDILTRRQKNVKFFFIRTSKRFPIG